MLKQFVNQEGYTASPHSVQMHTHTERGTIYIYIYINPLKYESTPPLDTER